MVLSDWRTAVRDLVVGLSCAGGQFVPFRKNVDVVSNGHFSKESPVS